MHGLITKCVQSEWGVVESSRSIVSGVCTADEWCSPNEPFSVEEEEDASLSCVHSVSNDNISYLVERLHYQTIIMFRAHRPALAARM